MKSTAGWTAACIVAASVVALLLGVFVASTFGGNMGFLFFLGVMFVFFGQGLYQVSADPPQVIIVTIFGDTTGVIRRSGLRWLPLRGLVFDAIPLDIGIVNEDIEEVSYFTKDNVAGKAPVSYSWQPISEPNAEAETADGRTVHPLVNFLAAGKKDGIHDIMNDKVIGTFVEFMRGNVETWQDALSVGDLAVSAIFKSITGEGSLPTSIRTSVLFKHFKLQKESYNEADKSSLELPADAADADVTAKIEAQIADDESGDFGRMVARDHPGVSYRTHLEERVGSRYKQLALLRTGRAKCDLPDLGVRFTRLNIGERVPDEKVVAAAGKIVIERLERESEKIQAEARRDQVRELASLKDNDGNPVPNDHARRLLELQQVESGKNINYIALSVGLPEGAEELVGKLADTVKAAAPLVAPIVAAKTTGKGGSGKGGSKGGGTK